MPMLFSPTIGAAITGGIGFCACAVRRAERSTRLICGARPSPRRGREQLDPVAIVPLMPAACAVRRPRAALVD